MALAFILKIAGTVAFAPRGDGLCVSFYEWRSWGCTLAPAHRILLPAVPFVSSFASDTAGRYAVFIVSRERRGQEVYRLYRLPRVTRPADMSFVSSFSRDVAERYVVRVSFLE